MKNEAKEILDLYLQRKQQLINARAESGIETIWRQAEADYIPHELGGPQKKVLVENERTEVSSYISLNRDEWRSKQSKNEPFIKIQTAISILFDRNPEATFDPASVQFEKVTTLIQQLYHRTWTNVNIGAKKELRKFIFNLAKYGFSAARRYYKKSVRRNMKMIKSYNTETGVFEYEEKDIVDVDDVFFQNLEVWDVWLDDTAKPDDPRSRRDWLWKETFSKQKFEQLLKDVKSDASIEEFKFSSKVLENESAGKGKVVTSYTSDDLIDVYFYESREDDIYIIEADEKLVKYMPLPREDKELSLVDTYWVLRNTLSPYGIGLNEIMRGNKVMLDRVRNMTIDQVVLAIYKMFFYSNSEQLNDEGGEVISLEPGKGKKVIDPKNISWLDVPGPGKEAFDMIEMLSNDIEDDTGVTKTLSGEITGKTAFEISLAQQGALKRLGTPLRNIKSALEWDAKLCVNLMKMIYSVPKVYTFTDPELVKEYVASVNADPQRYFMDEQGNFNALKYREFQLSIEQNEEGMFDASEKKSFLMVKPDWLEWEGEITIKVESMLEVNEPLERQMKLEMSNIILPLIAQVAQAPQLLNVYIKPLKQILKTYNENPKDWLPQEWLMASQAPMGMMPPMVPPGAAPAGAGAESMQASAGLGGMPEAQTVVPSTDVQPPGGAEGVIQQQSQALR